MKTFTNYGSSSIGLSMVKSLWKNRVITFFHYTSMKAHFMRFIEL